MFFFLCTILTTISLYTYLIMLVRCLGRKGFKRRAWLLVKTQGVLCGFSVLLGISEPKEGEEELGMLIKPRVYVAALPSGISEVSRRWKTDCMRNIRKSGDNSNGSANKPQMKKSGNC